MKKTIAITFILLLCLLVTACNSNENIKVGNSIKEKTNLTESENKQSRIGNDFSDGQKNKNDNGVAKKQNDVNMEEKRELFFGNWVITKVITYGRVSTYSDEEANKLIGKKIQYTPNIASYGNKVCKNPYYIKTKMSAKEFFYGNYVDLARLGVSDNSITEVAVCTDDKGINTWDSIGSDFFIKNQNLLILYDGGVFWELDRIK